MDTERLGQSDRSALGKSCLLCEEWFPVKRSHFDRRIYCSRKCHHAAMRGRSQEKQKPTTTTPQQRRAYKARWAKEKYRRDNPGSRHKEDIKGKTDAEHKQLRRARMKGVVNDLTPDQWTDILSAYGGRCAYCGDLPGKITMDHVVPISKGGGHTARNVVPACLPCNSGKKDREMTPCPPYQDKEMRQTPSLPPPSSISTEQSPCSTASASGSITISATATASAKRSRRSSKPSRFAASQSSS
jgi:5-methylcytosine-specific restriction endonuclease McrA